jgi:hypothetical protein
VPEASAAPVNPAYFGEQFGTGPMLAAPAPEIFFCYTDQLPRFKASCGVEMESALVIVDRVLAFVPMDAAEMENADGPKVLSAEFASNVVSRLAAFSGHD